MDTDSTRDTFNRMYSNQGNPSLNYRAANRQPTITLDCLRVAERSKPHQAQDSIQMQFRRDTSPEQLETCQATLSLAGTPTHEDELG